MDPRAWRVGPMSQSHDHHRERRLGRILAVLFGFVAVVISIGRLDTPVTADRPGSPARTVSVPGEQVSPAISPDGRAIAFVTRGIGDDSDIWLWSRVEGSWRLLTDAGDEGRPVFSPDGSRLAFVRVADGTMAIVEHGLAGGEERNLVEIPMPTRLDPRVMPGLSWSPDASALAFSGRDSSGRVGINLVLLDTLALRRVTDPPPGDVDLDPGFSPDGSSISFTRFRGSGDSDVWLVDLEGRERQLTRDHRNVVGHSWLRDGSGVLVSSNRTGQFELWSVALDSTTPRWRDSRESNLQNPSTSDDGTVVVEAWEYDANLWRVAEDGATERIVGLDGWDGSPRFSRDGTRIAFVTNRSGGWELWLADPDGSNQASLVRGAGVIDAPAWSPDGREIAFHSLTSDGVDIRIASVADGSVRQLTWDPAEDMHPAWSPSGEWIYFASDREDGWNVWRIGRDGADAQRVTSDGGYRAQAAADGSVFFTRRGQPGLWRLVHGEPAEIAIGALSAEDWASWQLSSDGIWFVQRRQDGPALARMRFFDGQVDLARVVDPAPLPHHASFDVSPDGNSVIWCRLDDQTSRVIVLPRL